MDAVRHSIFSLRPDLQGHEVDCFGAYGTSQ